MELYEAAYITCMLIVYVIRRAGSVSFEEKVKILQYISDNNLNAESTGSGLYYLVNNTGNGDVPDINSIVTVAYKGTLTDGTIFDQSGTSGATFPLSNVIQGWQEGIPLYSEGGSGILLIPSALGYGSQAVGSIPANSVLIFEVTLLNVN